MKTAFLWGWNDYPMREDIAMNRQRLARLMRAWRRSRTQGRRNFEFRLVSRQSGRRDYFVSTRGYINEDRARIAVITTNE